MPVSRARKLGSSGRPCRIGSCCGLAALFVLFGSNHLQDANASGDARTIALHHVHTEEDITVTFRRNGRYDEEALKKLNWFLRDWRTDQPTRMDPQLFDVLWEVQREFGLDKPIHVVSAFRSAQTNSMLRQRGRGVARQSQHMVGRAMDFFVPGVPLESLRVIGLRMQRGGVGYYPTSGSPFVHLDTGSVRHWPRMSREQLARVFPDGRTVHIPTDGQPLAGYTVALADVERRGGAASGPSLEAARHAGVISGQPGSTASERPKRGLLTWLFGASKDEEEESESATTGTTPARAPAAAPQRAPTVVASQQRSGNAKDKEQNAGRTAAIPLPPPRPAIYQVASAAPPAAAPRVVTTTRLVPGSAPTANDIINLRGFWEGLPPAEPMVTAAASKDDPSIIRPPANIPSVPDSTASIGAAAPDGSADRVAPDIALAYAAEPAADRRPRLAAATAGLVRLPQRVQPATTIAIKGNGEPAALSAPAPVALARARLGERYDDPWLRAMVWAPNARHYMTATLFTPPDFRELKPLLHKPTSSVMMTFSGDPHLGLVCERFGGSAIVFMSTVTFGMRTAALR